jgi:hypothetical protein
MENFDAVGRWRTEDSYERAGLGKKTWTVEPAGAFHKGPAFKSYHELRDLIHARVDDFARGYSMALIEYALGRSIGFRDEALVEKMTTEAKPQDFALRSFIQTLVRSEEFRTK